MRNNIIWVSCRHHTPLHIKMNHVVLIQMLHKIWIFVDFQIGKHFTGVTCFTVICREHICRNRLSKSPRTAVANVRIC